MRYLDQQCYYSCRIPHYVVNRIKCILCRPGTKEESISSCSECRLNETTSIHCVAMPILIGCGERSRTNRGNRKYCRSCNFLLIFYEARKNLDPFLLFCNQLYTSRLTPSLFWRIEPSSKLELKFTLT